MKKIISVLAMALLVIGAAQAQDQVRKMFVHMNDGSIIKIKAADIQEVTFEMDALPDVPTTIEEAKAMLVGFWKINSGETDDYYESAYFIFTENLEALFCAKFKDSVTDEVFAPYAGKYVVLGSFGEVIFPSEDPTTFYIGDEWNVGTNLQSDSFDYSQYGSDIVTYPCVRVEPFEYIMMGGDYLFKGKPALR